MPEWPNEVPFFDVMPGSDLTMEGDVLRDDMDVGPAAVRLRSSWVSYEREGVTTPLTTAQKIILQNFFVTVLRSGVLSFTATDPFDGATATFRIIGALRLQRVGANMFKAYARIERL